LVKLNVLEKLDQINIKKIAYSKNMF